MKKKFAKEFKKHYDEVISDYDIINEYNGFRCVRVFCKNSNQHNLLNKNGDVISDVWYDDEIIMSPHCIGNTKIYYARVRKNNKFNFIDKNGNLIFPNKWFTQLYNTDRAVGVDGKHYKYDLISRTLTEIEPEQCKGGHSGGYGMHLPNRNWF